MQKTIAKANHNFNKFLSELKEDLLNYVVRSIEKQLEADVDRWLYRNMQAAQGAKTS